MNGQLTARLVLGGLTAFRLFAADENAGSRIASEIERLQTAWSGNSPSDPAMKPAASSSQALLKAAGEALHSGRIYLSLERLAQATNLFHGLQVAREKSATIHDLPAFEVEWGKAEAEVASLSREARSQHQDWVPAALRALAETSLGRSVPLLDGGRGFAIATGPRDGLFYLGQAIGEAEFARLCASLRLASKGRGWTPRSLLPELLALQARTDAAFQPPRSIEQHSRFIALNSTLKLARELDATKSYYGALYQYLEAVRHYGMLDAAPVDGARQTELKTAVHAELGKLASSANDDSILQVFLERAASQSAPPDGAAPSADEWRSIQVTLSRVVPAYSAALKSPPPLRETKGKTIDVTLVRWPYT